MADRYPIRPYRGPESTIGTSDHTSGEILVTTDTHKLFWSDGTGLHELAYGDLILTVQSDLSGHVNDDTIHFTKDEIVLDDLDDVSISSPSTDQLLLYDGTSWVNQSHDFAENTSLHDALSISGDSRYLSLDAGTQTLTVNQVNIANTDHITGTLPVSSGGTSRTSLDSGSVLVGNGTSMIMTPTDLVWDDVNNRLGVNLSSPSVAVDVSGDIQASNLISDASGNSAQWNEAYSWGDHGVEGYLTTETDPIFTASDAYDINSTQITNWDTAYGWGDHGAEGYITENETITLSGDVSGSGKTTITVTILDDAVETSMISDANVTYGKIQDVSADRLLGRVGTTGTLQEIQIGTNLEFDGTTLNVVLEETNIYYSNGNVGIGQETPAYTLDVLGDINFTGDLYQNGSALNISGWDEAYSWGDHSLGGYLQESDFTGHVVYDITATDISGWDNASTLAHPAVSISGDSRYLSFDSGTQVLTVNQVDLSDSVDITGVLPVTYGGTNRTSLDENKVLVGNGTGALISSGLYWDNANNRLGVNMIPSNAVDISGTVYIYGSGIALTVNGGIQTSTGFHGDGSSITDLTFNNITTVDISGASSGELLTFNGTNWVNQSHDFADNTSLHPAVSLTTSRSYLSLNASTQELTADYIDIINDTSGTLNVARGGTGRTSLTSGKILVGAGTSAITIPTNLHWDDANSRLGVNDATPSYSIDVDGSIRVTNDIYAQGDIGAGKLVPDERLDVNGNIQLSGDLLFDTTSTQNIFFDESGGAPIIGFGAAATKNINLNLRAAGAGTGTGGKVTISGGLGSSYGNIELNGHRTLINNFSDNSRVGINLTDPSYALDVLGDIQASGNFRGDGSLLTDIDHTNLLSVGSNTHAQIDSHISDSTIHFTKGDVVLNDLSGVSISSPSSTHVLQYNGTSWVNSKLNFSDITGTITDTQHGSRGGDALHALVTTSAHGFMSSTDKTKLNGIENGAEVNVVTSVASKTGDVTLVKGDVGLGNLDNVQQLPMSYLSTATDLGGGSASDTKVPSQLAAKTYIDSEINEVLSSSDAMVYKGVIDASTEPDYPSGTTGDTYKFSDGGKIGGSSGEIVETGDMLICLNDNTGGSQSAVGTDWNVIQTNVEGYVIGPDTSVDGRLVLFDGATGALIKQASISVSDIVLTTRNLIAGNGLTGGGTLASDRTFTLGTPGTLTGATSNDVSTSSHTHAISSDHVPSDSTSVLLAAKGLWDHIQSSTTDHDDVYIRVDEFDGGTW